MIDGGGTCRRGWCVWEGCGLILAPASWALIRRIFSVMASIVSRRSRRNNLDREDDNIR
jgi:hypothetical protein